MTNRDIRELYEIVFSKAREGQVEPTRLFAYKIVKEVERRINENYRDKAVYKER